MNSLDEFRAMILLAQLEDNAVMFHALIAMNVAKMPWYKRPFIRLRGARRFRAAIRERIAENYKTLAKRQAAVSPPPVDEVEISADPFAN